jgi:hypothetical protein
MPSGTYAITISAGGVSISMNATRTADAGKGWDPALPPGKAGTLTTRTDNDTGVATLGSGHGLTDADMVSVYWEGGRRYGVDVTATTATTVSIDGGAGDNLPDESTPLVVTKEVKVNTTIDGDALELFGVMAQFPSLNDTSRAHVSFYGAGDSLIHHLDLVANIAIPFDPKTAGSNPFSGGPIAYAMASNGNSEIAAQLLVAVLQDSTPEN